MTVTRAVDDLEQREFIAATREGKARVVRPKHSDGRALWESIRQHMASPVARREQVEVTLPALEAFPLAGLSALSAKTMLADPPIRVRAVSQKRWREFRAQHAFLTRFEVPGRHPPGDQALLELELWRYEPELFRREDRVDPLSLCLSLQDDPDERVQAALRQLVENFFAHSGIYCGKSEKNVTLPGFRRILL